MSALPSRTPCVAVHLPRLLANIGRVRALGRTHGVAVRPHAKTHKCVEIARMQMAEGAVGITVAKPGEALVFLRAGIPSVTLAYPVIEAQIVHELLDAAHRTGSTVQFVVDSLAGVRALETATRGVDSRVAAFIEVDVGLNRCGVPPGSAAMLELALALSNLPGLRLAGLLSHAGQAYGAATPEAIGAIAESERALMLASARTLRAAGVEVPMISVGSTPTVCRSESFEGIGEIRPGNYVFFDRTALRLGIATRDEIALAVITTVVSVNDTYCIIDAGSKTLSSDLGPHGTGGPMGHGEAYVLDRSPGAGLRVARLSEEHGFLEHGGAPLAIGTRLMVIPNHSCPVANLADEFVVLDASSAVSRTWTVAARGKNA